MEFKIPKINPLIPFALFLIVLFSQAMASPIFSMPYRYESGFHVYLSDLDLNGRNITQMSMPVSNVSKNYTVDPYDYLVLVDATKAGTAVNLSIEHPTNKSGREYKFMRTTDGNSVNIESARDFIGNSSNSSAGWGGNVFYFNYTPGSTFNLTMMSVRVYSRYGAQITTGVRFALYNNTNLTGTNATPYQLLDTSSNTTVGNTGWTHAEGWNGTTVVQAGTMYWIAFQTTNSSTPYYIAWNTSTEKTIDVMTYNQGQGYGSFQQRINVSAFANNQSVNRFVPNIAVNMAYIDGQLGGTNLTNVKYQHTLVQSDGVKWW